MSRCVDEESTDHVSHLRRLCLTFNRSLHTERIGLTSMIEIKYETDNPERREIVERYFDMDDRGRFLEDVTEIAADYGMTWKQVVSVVRSSSTALSTVHRCEVCGKRKEFTSRQDIRENRTTGIHLCSRVCREAERQRKEKKRPQADEERPPGSAGESVERLLRRRVGRVTKALSGVTDELSTISSELREIKSFLSQGQGTGQQKSRGAA